MKAITLLGHRCTGHGSWPPRPNIEADDYLLINGQPVHCVGHGWASHCNATPQCHASTLAAGSALLQINGRAAGRVGDPVACGGSVAQGDDYWILD